MRLPLYLGRHEPPPRDERCGAHLALPAALGLVTAVVYSWVGCHLYATFRSGMDLAIFDQAIRALSHFQAPISAMKSPGMNLFGDHFHPVILLAAPFYWIWDDPRVLIVIQALAIAASVVILTRCAQRGFVRSAGSTLVAASCGLSLATALGVQYAALFDFHEVALGMPILAVALSGLVEQRWRRFAIASVLLLLMKEDAGLIVLGLGMAAFVKRRRAMGAGLAGLAIAWTAFTIKVLIPLFNPLHTWNYASSVGGMEGQLRNAWHALVTDGGLTRALLWMLVAVAFAALRSPIILAALPMLASRAITDNVNYWRIYNHYNLLPATIISFAAVDALQHLRMRRALAALIVVVALAASFRGPTRQQYEAPVKPARTIGAQQAVASIPAGASVAADAYLTPHLTKLHPQTQQVRPARADLANPYADDLGRPLDVDYLVFDLEATSNARDAGWVRPAIAWFAAHGYRQAHRFGSYVVMYRRAA